MADKVITPDEADAVLNNIAASPVLDQDSIADAASLVTEKSEVLDRLLEVLRLDIGAQPDMLPMQPMSEPSLPLSVVNQLS